MWLPAAASKKKKQPQIYPAGQKTGCCVAFAQSPHRVHRLSVKRLALPSRSLGTLRSVWQGIGGAGSVKMGAFCGVALSLWRLITTPSQSVAIRHVLGVFCGDISTLSPTLSQTLSPTLQMASTGRGFGLSLSQIGSSHPPRHPKSHPCAPIGTLYRNILSTISAETNRHRASPQGASRGAFTVDLTPGFDGV